MKGSIVLCTLFLLGTVLAQQRFSANVRHTQPGMSGHVSGVMYYDFPSTLMRIEYSIGVTEIYNFTDGVRYVRCGSTCNAESIRYNMPRFFKASSDAADAAYNCVGGGGDGFRRSGAGDKDVSRIAFTGSNVCRAQLGDGTYFEFTGVNTSPDFSGKWSTSGCPQKTCKQKLDIMLVMDESGSISSGEWSTMKQFANRFTQAFSVSESEAKIGLVAYSSSAVLRFAYQNDEQSFRNTMNNLQRYYGGGSTYTNSALNVAANAQRNYGRSGVKSITVVITDGFCSCNDNSLVTSSAPLKNSGYVFAVGVDGADTKELALIASGSGGTATINGKSVKTTFFANQWDQLNTLLKDLIDATCTEFPGNPCGSGCNGFCGCNKQCICPDDCSSVADFCNDGVCSTGAAGAGCRQRAKNDPCNDNNACTNEYCDAAAGRCQSSAVVCPDRPCYTKSCDTAKGCVYAPVDCTDSDPCTAEFCDVSLGANGQCAYPPKDCDRCKYEGKNATTCSVGKSKCENWDCVQTGQVAECKKISDVDCDDLNACTTDSCDAATGVCSNVFINCNDSLPCTIDTCDPATGCVNAQVNETAYCDDQSLCTIDKCANNVTGGCYHINIVCNGTDNPCLVGVCNSVLGCQYPSKNCAEEPGIREKLGDCYAALCNDGAGLVTNITTEKLGCYLSLQPDAVIDDCGVCRGDGTTCGFPLTIAEAAGIGAGVIGAIAAGAAVFAIASGIGAKKGYDAYMRNKNNMSGAQSNPMYNDNGRTGQNPMYEMK